MPASGRDGALRPLRHEELRRLYLGLQEVLKEAIKLGGSSVSDYVDAMAKKDSSSCSIGSTDAKANRAWFARRQ